MIRFNVTGVPEAFLALTGLGAHQYIFQRPTAGECSLNLRIDSTTHGSRRLFQSYIPSYARTLVLLTRRLYVRLARAERAYIRLG